MQDLIRETIKANHEAMQISRENMVYTNKVNKRYFIIIILLIIASIFQSFISNIRDSNIAKSYFDQSLIQETTKDGLKQEFKGGD